MDFNSLEELLVAELLDLHDAEKQLIKALDQWQEITNSPELKSEFKSLLATAKQQFKRIEVSLNNLQADLKKGFVCEAMKGLISEGDQFIKSNSTLILKDAALIGTAQKIAHYKIASYGTAKAHAKILELTEIATLLDQSLEEEGFADKKLTKIAEGSFFSSGINQKAVIS